MLPLPAATQMTTLRHVGSSVGGGIGHVLADGVGPTSDPTAQLASAWIDRDVGWLEFNARVLHEALDDRTPLLERLKFLAIFSANLDEFFMKRIGLIRPMSDDSSLAAQERREQLLTKRAMIVAMLERQATCYTEVLRPRLAEHAVYLVGLNDLSDEQRTEVSRHFDTEIWPVLTPLGLDVAHPFPYVSNLSTSWAFRLQDPVNEEFVLVRVKVPRELRQWIRVHSGVQSPARVFVSLDQVIAANAEKLFPGMVVESASLFRVCRDADVELDDDQGVRRASASSWSANSSSAASSRSCGSRSSPEPTRRCCRS